MHELKKNGDVAMPNNSLAFNYVLTSPGQSPKAIKWAAQRSDGYHVVLLLPNQINHLMTMNGIE